MPTSLQSRKALAVRAVAIALLATVSAAVPSPAAAAKTAAVADAEVLARTATELFKLKQFERAAQLFMQAYAKSHKPALVFNAARAYQEAGKWGDAAGLFRLYLSISSDAEGVADAKERLQVCEAKGATPAAPAPVAAPPTPPVESPPPAPVSPPAQPPAPAPLPAQSQPPAPAPAARAPAPVASTTARAVPANSPSRTWAWGASGAAVVAGAAGGALMALGASDANTANRTVFAGVGGPAAYSTQFDAAQQKWNVGAGLAVVAVVGAGVATWLWLQSAAAPKTVYQPQAVGEALAWAAEQAQ